jgi:dolichol kinase
MKRLFTELFAALFTGALGLFCAGAIYLPIAADYFGRVLFTLGAMSLVYGSESVLRLGHVKACTIDFSVGKCNEHNLVIPSLVLWACFYLLWRWRVWKNQSASERHRLKAGPRNQSSN